MYGIDQLIDKKKKLFHGLPQEEMQRRAKVSGDLLDALATEKVLAEKADAKNALNLAMQGNQKTIVQENEDNLLGRTQQETAEGVSGVLKNKKARMDQNLKRVAQLGIGGAKRPNMAVPMAQGGIIGYFDGKAIDMENEKEEEERKKRFTNPGLAGIMQPNLKKLKEDAFTDIAKRSGITPRESTITTDASGFQKGTDNFNVPTTQLGKYEPPVAKDRSQGITTALPNMPNQNIIPPAVLEKENLPKDVEPGDSKEDLGEKNRKYNEWLERLLTVLSAPASGRGLGGGNRARAYLQYSQRIFDNRAKIREIEADELEAKAKMDLNKLTSSELTYSRLVGRQTAIQKEIQKVADRIYKGQLGYQLDSYDMQLADPSKLDQFKLESILASKEGIQKLINDAIEDQTKQLLADRKVVTEKIDALDFNIGKGPPKKVSP